MKGLWTWIGGALLLVLVSSAAAQVTVGENVSLDLNALLQAGYTADYGNFTNSDHGFTFGGNAALSGSYYSPSFLSFNINPYYNQSRLNSTSQSLSDSSGVSASASIFSGSNYPGSISYNKSYNSSGIFGLPGFPNYTTHGNGDALNIGWGINKPGLPNLSFNFLEGHTDNSIYGVDEDATSAFHSFNFHANYQIAGFNLTGGYINAASQSQFPEIFTNQQEETADSHNSGFNFGASHKLPWYGSFTANYNHSYFTSEYADTSYSGAVDTVNASANFHPLDKLDLGVSSNYTNNLLGSLYQTIITSGGVLQQNTPGSTSTSFNVDGYGSYKFLEHLFALANVDYRQQSYLGSSFSGTTVSGSVTYWRHLLGGTFSSALTLSLNENTSTSQATTGLLALANYSRQIGGWTVNGAANYSQNAQTALISYTTSGFGFNGSVGHKLRSLSWNATAGGSKSLLNIPGYGNSGQYYSTSLSGKWIGVNANYTKTSGNSLLGSTGLVPTPLPPVIIPTDLIFYGGHGYGIGLGSSPIRRLILTASYSRAFSNTLSGTTGSENTNESINGRITYDFRQLSMNAGYSKFVQGFSASGLPPSMLSSYYFGISRWFNFF
ncbi:MAG: hypothetical protein ACLPND_12645 [Candidatus Korobacteraceae bacterium]|jgi:hypothetical protein